MVNEAIDTAPTYVIPTADYPFTVQEVERVPSQFNDDGQFRWTLAFGNVANIDGEIVEDKTRWYHTPVRASSSNKLGKFAAALGLDLDGLTTGAFIGRQGIASVVVETKADGSMDNVITGIRPMPAKGARPVAPAPAAKPAANGATAAAQPVNGGDPWE